MPRNTVLLGAGAALAGRAVLRRARALELSGRVALVTGGSRGLGFALARRLLAEGARVAICARGEEQLRRAQSRLGADVVAVACDVSDREQVDRLVAVVTERLGPIDVLVNNAGVISVGPLSTQTHADFEELLSIQLWGPINCTLAVLPRMLERGLGRIANVTSIGGKVSVPWLLPYDTAKFAAVGFSEGLRAELAGTGVKVTTIVPGLMRTGSFEAAFFKGDRAETEYSLFTPLAAAAPAISAERATRRIIEAVRRGDAEITLGLHAKLAARAAGMAPALTSDVLGLVARALPQVQGTGRVRGGELSTPVSRSPLTLLGRRAARDLNQ